MRAPSSVSGPVVAGLEVEPVKEAMDYRSEKDTRHNEEEDAGEERIERGEQLAPGGPQNVHRPHPAENHRGIEQGVDPRQPLDSMVAQDAEHECGDEDGERYQRVAG